MAVNRVGVDSPFSNQTFRAVLTDIFAGTVCSILSIAYCLSYAALIFTGPLEHALSYGVAITFLSATVGGSIVALRGSLPFAVAGPDSNISVVLAALVATVVHRVVADGGSDLLEPALIALCSATAITGLLLCVLGFTHAGRAIRFVPYPVIGGFLGATGWLMVTGAIQVATNQRPTLANIDAFLDSAIAAKLAAGLLVATALFIALRRSKSPFALPGVLLGAIAATYLFLFLAGSPLVVAQAEGWMFRPQPMAGLTSPWQPGALRGFAWTALPTLAGDLLAVMFVTIITLVLNTTGIETGPRPISSAISKCSGLPILQPPRWADT